MNEYSRLLSVAPALYSPAIKGAIMLWGGLLSASYHDMSNSGTSEDYTRYLNLCRDYYEAVESGNEEKMEELNDWVSCGATTGKGRFAHASRPSIDHLFDVASSLTRLENPLTVYRSGRENFDCYVSTSVIQGAYNHGTTNTYILPVGYSVVVAGEWADEGELIVKLIN